MAFCNWYCAELGERGRATSAVNMEEVLGKAAEF
jgi:hypothetical protein